MDSFSHILSGIVISQSIPDDPDPKLNFIKKSLPIIASLAPDFPVAFIWRSVAKKTGKINPLSFMGSGMTIDDYDNHAASASPWIQIYQIFHGLPFLILLAFVEMMVFQGLFATWSLLVHQLYDLPTHKSKSEDINPKPLFPFLNWTWKWGLFNPWGLHWLFIVSWILHLLTISVIFVIKNPHFF
jgi:hypothetical protein